MLLYKKSQPEWHKIRTSICCDHRTRRLSSVSPNARHLKRCSAF